MAFLHSILHLSSDPPIYHVRPIRHLVVTGGFFVKFLAVLLYCILDKSIWAFPKIRVPPKSSILIGFSIITNHPFWGTPILGHLKSFVVGCFPQPGCETSENHQNDDIYF